jgi:hypothetical protein
VAGVGLVRVALLQQLSAVACEDRLDCRQALRRLPVGVIRGDHVAEGTNQAIGPFLMREMMERQRLLAAAMDPHDPLDEHLT